MVRKEGRSEERKCLWRRNSNRKGKKGEVRHREKEREREILCRVGSKYMLSALRKAHRLKLWDPGVSAPAPLEET